MARVLLQDQQRELFQQERQLAHELEICRQEFEVANSCAAALHKVTTDLEELFLLVIVGEFNVGKSACINALLHDDVLEEGVIPTTHQVTILRYGEQRAQYQREQGLLEVVYNADFLRDISIVDTPGVNAVLLEHQRLTEEFVPRSDLILFITSADRPFTQSERVFLEQIRAWGKKVVILLNKIDMFQKPGELEKVLSFIRDQCQRLLGFKPDILPLSARLAHQSRTAIGHQAIELWKQSRVDQLEAFLFKSLDEKERVRLKLLSPLGVMQRVLAETRDVVEQQARLLAEDARTIATIEHQLRLYGDDMEKNFHHRMHEIENVVINMRMRGDRFFLETIRFGRLLDLVRGDRIRTTFEREVLSDSETQIGRSVQEIIDWLVEQEHQLWHNVMEYLDRRCQVSLRRDEQMVGSIGKQFDYNRRQLLQVVARTAESVINSYNQEAEIDQLAQKMRNTVAQMAIAGASGVGLGALIAGTVGTLAADLTGLITGIALIALGIGILPLRRKRAQKEFASKMEALGNRLNQTLTNQFQKELNSSLARLQECLAPYTRFVRAQQEKTEKTRARTQKLAEQIQMLKAQIEHL